MSGPEERAAPARDFDPRPDYQKRLDVQQMRCSVLSMAVGVAAARPEVDVLELAGALEAWVVRD